MPLGESLRDVMMSFIIIFCYAVVAVCVCMLTLRDLGIIGSILRERDVRRKSVVQVVKSAKHCRCFAYR
jgi:hypothetical protein